MAGINASTLPDHQRPPGGWVDGPGPGPRGSKTARSALALLLASLCPRCPRLYAPLLVKPAFPSAALLALDARVS